MKKIIKNNAKPAVPFYLFQNKIGSFPFFMNRECTMLSEIMSFLLQYPQRLILWVCST